MRPITPILFFFFAFVTANAQKKIAVQSLKGYGGSAADQIISNVTKTNDGGFVLAMESNSPANTGNIDSFCSESGERIIFLKYNHDGSVLEWNKCYWATGDSILIWIYPNNTSYILIGSISTGGIVINKEDASGSLVWTKNYSKGNGSLLDDAIQTSDGGYIALSRSYYSDTNASIHYGSWMDADMWIIKLDSNGNKVWSKVIGGSANDWGTKLINAPNKGVYVAGITLSNDHDCTGNHSSGGYDAYIAKLDSNGNLIWHKDYGGSGTDEFYYACENLKGGLIACGYSTSTDGDVHHHISPAGGQNYWATEIDTSGTIVWENCNGGNGSEVAHTICKATDGSIWLGGYSLGSGGEIDTFYGFRDAFFVHADSVGKFISEKVLGSTQDDEGLMIYALSNNSVIAGGFYWAQNAGFSSLYNYGAQDAFLTVFSPWPENVDVQNEATTYIQAFPNPATDEVKVRINQTNCTVQISISNVLGAQVYSNNLSSSQTELRIQTGNWLRGVYFIQVLNERGFKSISKVILV